MILASWLVLSAVPAAPGQMVQRAPRLVRLFDFEDTDDQGVKLGLGHDLPRHFFAIGRDPLVPDRFFYRLPVHDELIHRAGYPDYSTVHFDDAHVVSGDYSLKLTADGGNAGVFLEVGALIAVPGSNYRVTARLRTAELRGAAAHLTAYFVDAAGRRLDASAARSEPIRTDGAWADASVMLSGEYEDAAWIGLEVELLQPQPQPDHPLGRQQLIFPDVTGSLWVDDVAVWQLPHVQVSTDGALNVHRGPQPPQFELTMRDLTGRSLTATSVVYDHLLHEVDRSRRRVGAGAPMQWRWTPRLPGHGWYIVDLSIRDDDDPRGEPVARTLGAVLWLADEGPLFTSDAQRFVLVAEDLPAGQGDLIAPLLDVTQLRAVVLSIWDRQDTLATIEQRVEALDDQLNRIISAERRVTLSLYPLPRELAEADGVNSTHALGMLQADPRHWLGYLRPVLHRHGQRVRQWQLGRADRAEAFFYADPGTLLDRVRAQFEQMTPGPRLIVPWRADQARRSAGSDAVAYAMDVPPGVPAEAVADYLAEWRHPPARVALYLREPGADEVDPRSRAVNLAMRMIEGWRADAQALAITRPWTASAERGTAILPDPLLGVFVNTAHRLSGRRVIAGHVPIGEGLRAMVLDGPQGGMLIAWAQSAPPQDAALRMMLGGTPVAIDLWGNRTSVRVEDGKHVLALTDAPLFIEGIDPRLALLRAGFRVDEPFIESRQEPHRRKLILTNPYPMAISGRLRLTGPATWDISPRSHPFSIAPGASAEFPVVVRFPLAEVAGRKRLTAQVEFDADQPYRVDLSAPVELGLTDVRFKSAVVYEVGPNGRTDALLTLVLTNTGERGRSYHVFAMLPGRPREERLVPELTPDQTMIKHMRFQNVDPGTTFRVGVREANGSAMLNVILNSEGQDEGMTR